MMTDRLRIYRQSTASPASTQSVFTFKPDQHPSSAPVSQPENGRVPLAHHSFSKIPIALKSNLAVSQTSDPAEQEADRIADQVMRMATPDASSISTMQPIQDTAQRKCAACEEEEKHQDVTATVNRAVRSNGQSLDPGTLAFMGSRFGHDFSQVKIHTDAPAAESAQALNARAYTVGQDIVFGAGQYAPDTEDGKRLLAHELTHVVQQKSVDSAVQREAFATVDAAVPADSGPIRMGEAIAPDPAEVDTSGLGVDVAQLFPIDPTLLHASGADTLNAMSADFLTNLQTVLASLSPTMQASCSPNRALTWKDFGGSPSGSFAAKTVYRYDVQTGAGAAKIMAVLNSSKSWVKPEFKDPTNRATSDCDKAISQCEKAFNEPDTATWGPLIKNTSQCSASIPYDSSVIATQRSDCAGAIGTEYDRVNQLESARLLRHEQTHFDIGCVLASKGTAALLSNPKDSKKILSAVERKTAELQQKYDTATDHGCNASTQASWEADVTAGLPSVKIP